VVAVSRAARCDECVLARWIGEPGFGADDPTLREGVIWFFREVARTVCGEPDVELLRELARMRDEPVGAAWLDGYLVERRSVFDWTDADEPGKALLAAGIAPTAGARSSDVGVEDATARRGSGLAIRPISTAW
jgi:hypothetical protein